MQVGLISDTHSYLDPVVFKAFDDCDEVWHAGDFGALDVAEQLEKFKPFRGVYGNIDDGPIRDKYPLDLRFQCEGVDVWMTHIAGYPGRYEKRARRMLDEPPIPQVLIYGHSHILRVDTDKKRNDLKCINPGAAGHHGFHLVRTLIKCEFIDGEVRNMRVIELGPRGRRPNQPNQRNLEKN